MNKNIGDILTNYLQNNCSENETAYLLHYLTQEENQEQSEGLVTSALAKANDMPIAAEDQKRLDLLLTQIISTPAVPKRATLKITRLTKYLAAAIVLITFSIGLILYFSGNNSAKISYQNDVAPGSNKAVLTLANGKKVDLGKTLLGEVALAEGISLSKSKEGLLVYQVTENTKAPKGTFNTIETPKGGQYQIVLPDGSKVWLNAASSLKFPVSFTSNTDRRVKLNGEAYFEIVHDANKPFIVESKKQEVSVLGTHFNVKAYENEASNETTLIQGKVKVSALDNQQSAIIQPNQQAIIDGGAVRIKHVDANLAVAWKNGLIVFEQEDIREIMKVIARWYDVDVEFQSNSSFEHFSGSISRFSNISDVLRMLQLTNKVKFEVRGRRVIVMN
ncbi:FecR family protein [Pedobacter sp. MW01-1-1]|uniref:FecR family protein n=1 Tax=Pedobacter sp. MW01-1-1 TaxID=3383027 RepID=UPI003FF01F05